MFEKTASREENGWKAARESSRGNDFELREFSDATLYVFNSQPQAGVKTFNTLIRAGEPNVAIMSPLGSWLRSVLFNEGGVSSVSGCSAFLSVAITAVY